MKASERAMIQVTGQQPLRLRLRLRLRLLHRAIAVLCE